jgi:hypothetical protein
MSLPDRGIWSGVACTIDAHPDVARLRAHGLAPLAAAHWRDTGHSLTQAVDMDRVTATALGLQAERLLREVTSFADQPVLLLKGPEVAARYPELGLRDLTDVDILVADTDAMERSFSNAGWLEYTGPGELRWYDELHHAHPFVLPGSSLPIEPHRRPNWPIWGRAPGFPELHDAAVESAVAIDGLLAPKVEHHALLVLAHSWADVPFERFSQLIDFALLVEECDADELTKCARRWQLSRLLSVGLDAIDSLLLGRRSDALTVRWFAPHLRALATPTRARAQFDRYASGFFVTSPTCATSAMAAGSLRRLRVRRRDRRAGAWR